MSYALKRQKVSEIVKFRLRNSQSVSPEMIRMIVDRLMVREFSSTYNVHKLGSPTELNSKLFELSKKETIAYLARGLLISIYAIIVVAIRRKRKPTNTNPVSLVFALPTEIIKGNCTSQDLKHYFVRNLQLLNKKPPERFLVQTRSKGKLKSIHGLNFVPHIGVALLLNLQIRRRLIIKSIAGNLFRWVRAATINPEILMIGPEYIVDSIAMGSKLESVITSVITTQSTSLCLPSAFHYFPKSQKIMFWYSDNSQQIRLNAETSLAKEDYSYLKQELIDIHLVWTESWAQILRRETQKLVYAVGPILFKNLPNQIQIRSDQKLLKRILVFDVTPKRYARSSQDYYNIENSIRFVKDILECASEFKGRIAIDLKPKRKKSRLDSEEYISYLKSNSQNLRLLSPIQNFEKLVSQYDLVICIPYTSPALISQHMGIKTIFYNPSVDYLIPKIYEGIHIVTGKLELRNFISDLAT